MLFFVTADKKEIIWHVGSKKPSISKVKIVEIQADGHELEYIKNKFTNIPMSTNKVINWYGDIAKFIFNNMF